MITIKWIHYKGRLEILYSSKKEGEGGHMGSQELKKGDLLRVKMGQMGSSMSDVKEKNTYHCVNELIKSHQFLYHQDLRGPIIYFFDGSFPSRHKQSFFIYQVS